MHRSEPANFSYMNGFFHPQATMAEVINAPNSGSYVFDQRRQSASSSSLMNVLLPLLTPAWPHMFIRHRQQLFKDPTTSPSY